MKSVIVIMAFMLSVILWSVPVYASELEDDLSGTSQDTSGFSGSLPEEDAEVADIMKGFRPMGAEELAGASQAMSPVVDIIGSAIGIIMVITASGVFLMTALGLLYIVIPPIRGILYKGDIGGAQAGGAMPGMGGYGRMGGYGMGGYGGMGGAPGGAAPSSRHIQWVPDDAIQCVAMITAGQQPQAQSMGMGGYGMGMGGMQQQPQEPMTVKSAIGTYLKLQMKFIVYFGVCFMVLTSSVLLDTGINLGQWIIKLFAMINNNMPL